MEIKIKNTEPAKIEIALGLGHPLDIKVTRYDGAPWVDVRVSWGDGVLFSGRLDIIDGKVKEGG